MCAVRSLGLRVGFVVLGATIMVALAAAQTGLATITGIVSDASGAGVPSLTVTATNQDTNIAHTGVTNVAGNYHAADQGGILSGHHFNRLARAQHEHRSERHAQPDE